MLTLVDIFWLVDRVKAMVDVMWKEEVPSGKAIIQQGDLQAPCTTGDMAGCSREDGILSCIPRRICRAVESFKDTKLRKACTFWFCHHFAHLCARLVRVQLHWCYQSRDEADYFYVVQSGSFQVSKTDAAASAEKILDPMGCEDFKHVHSVVQMVQMVQIKTFQKFRETSRDSSRY